jgi:hypothetical protein
LNLKNALQAENLYIMMSVWLFPRSYAPVAPSVVLHWPIPSHLELTLAIPELFSVAGSYEVEQKVLSVGHIAPGDLLTGAQVVPFVCIQMPFVPKHNPGSQICGTSKQAVNGMHCHVRLLRHKCSMSL